MEHLLNLLWFCVVAGLALLALLADRRGQLRCSLPVALGAIALLALVLFPALSMTDDLQRARMDTETAGRYLGDTLSLGVLDSAQLATVAVLPLLLMLVLMGGNPQRERLPRRGDRAVAGGTHAEEPYAQRPPPLLSPAA